MERPRPPEFDAVARVYDRSRDPMEPEVLARVREGLTDHGVRALLEVGVGTGRIALALRAPGLEILGVDLSSGMLTEARRKGLARLLRGSAYRLPLRDASLDGALFVHVLHLLDDPRLALQEAVRVSRAGAFALLRPEGPSSEGETPFLEARRTFFGFLAEEGFPVPERWDGPEAREVNLLRRFPPDGLVPVEDREVTESTGELVRMLAEGGSRHTATVPAAARERAGARTIERLGTRDVRYRRRLALARWGRPPAEDVVQR